jgi:predicted metalloendopeptidase
LSPGFDWPAFYRESSYPQFETVNVESPKFYKQLNDSLTREPLDHWKAYFRFHVANAYSPFLSQPFVDENFNFDRAYLRGAKEQQPRWRRCVQYADYNLGEALGQAYVRVAFSPQLKADALDMVDRIEAAMRERITHLDWMSDETKKQALTKLACISHKDSRDPL